MFEITIASQPIPLKHFQNTTFVQFITIFSKLGFQLHFIPVRVKYKVPVPYSVDRLISGAAQIDDAQAGMGQAHRAAHVKAGRVRSTMVHQIHHADEKVAFIFGLGVINNSSYSAHELYPYPITNQYPNRIIYIDMIVSYDTIKDNSESWSGLVYRR